MKWTFSSFLLCIFIFLVSCHSRPEGAMKSREVPVIYPDYVGVTVPVGIAPLNFCMVDERTTSVYVEIKGKKGGSVTAWGDYAAFNVDDWHQLLRENRGSDLLVTVFAKTGGTWIRYRAFPIHVSHYPLQEWGVTYRLVDPGYEIYGKMGLYQRALGDFTEKAILVNTQSPGMCINCHTANRTDPGEFVFHVRGPHGATFIRRQGRDEWLQAKNETLGSSMVYPYWHPSGRYCAFSTNQTHQMFHSLPGKRIEVYDTSSDILIYCPSTHTIIADTLLKRKGWSENCPVFSPDGRTLYFTTARQQVYPSHYRKQQYDLCRVSFDPATGRTGQRVDTLVHAAAMGKSVTWPRPSYDGRYLMYTLMDYGYFSIWHEESDLWLLDLHTGKSCPMTEVNSQRAESFHNWNINSHWFLFTSRRGDGLYTRLYFASIDSRGHLTKPFLLPQKNPRKDNRDRLYSYNTPDFTSRPVMFNATKAGNAIESDRRVKTGYRPQ